MILEDVKVLITCSGLGSRLGDLTNFTNKSLVRVGKTTVLTRIIESYPKNTKFVITLGHYADHIRQYIKIAHSDRQIEFVSVDRFEGPGSSLAYSMLQAKELLECPFIFHACDTITSQHNSYEDQNCIWISKNREGSSSYRSALTHGRQLKLIQDKGASEVDPVYIGKCLIKDYADFWSSLNHIYRQDMNDRSLSDCHAINEMLVNGNTFFVKEEPDWIDIGNLDSLNIARLRFKEDSNVLDKNDESIFFIDDKVIKFFHNSDVVSSRVKRVNYLNRTTPEIVDSTNNFFSYKKFKGDVLSRTDKFNDKMMTRLLDWANHNLWSKTSTDSIRQKSEDFYITKTKERIKKYHDDRKIKECDVIINGLEVPSTTELLIESQDLLFEHIHTSFFHGDFILENVLIDEKENFTLIDWRQDFGKSIMYGDAYYDLSKMNHNLIVNHDLINDGHYTINIDDNHVKVDILCSKKLLDARRSIEKFCVKNGFNIKKVDVLTSIIWMNMAPLHDKHFGDFLFYFGKYNLMRSIKNEY